MIGLGELYAFFSSTCFALSVVYLKIGQNRRPSENGVFMTSLVNLGMYLVFLVIQAFMGGLTPLTISGLIFFIIAGLTNTLFGRWAWLQSVRAIGPSRGTALKVTSPVFSTAMGYLFLSQPVTWPMMVGIFIVIAGVIALSQDSKSGVRAAKVSSPGDPPAGTAPRRRWRFDISEPAVAQGVIFGILSALGYATGSVLRKLGLDTVSDPVEGALIGSIVAVGTVLISDAIGGNLRRRWADNVASVPIPFVVAGVFAGFAQLSSFSALLYTSVAVSSTIGSTQGMIAALFSLAFFRSLDTITVRSVAAMVVVCIGVEIVLFFPA
jgi:drug/metabolite transporter (DMT)-like permease